MKRRRGRVMRAELYAREVWRGRWFFSEESWNDGIGRGGGRCDVDSDGERDRKEAGLFRL